MNVKKQFELVERVYKDAAMGRYSINKVLDMIKNRDNKITEDVKKISDEYSSYEEKAKEILISREVTPEEEGAITKMMSSMGIYKEVMSDNSDSAIADMLIQGMVMGITEMEKLLKNVGDDIIKDDEKLAKEFLKFQEKSKKKIEKYL